MFYLYVFSSLCNGLSARLLSCHSSTFAISRLVLGPEAARLYTTCTTVGDNNQTAKTGM